MAENRISTHEELEEMGVCSLGGTTARRPVAPSLRSASCRAGA